MPSIESLSTELDGTRSLLEWEETTSKLGGDGSSTNGSASESDDGDQ